ncbi:hypothetical protein DPV78_008596 [Talaromyces pinophilus]|nr:hypothetical protein DPV78_008596 [Talaromyces pinophilus]
MNTLSNYILVFSTAVLKLDQPCKDKMLFGSLPVEVLLLICDNLNIADLNALARTCSSLVGLLDPLLYQQAIKSGNYKSQFIFAVIHGQSSVVSKFFKAGASMSAFDKCRFFPMYPNDEHWLDLAEVWEYRGIRNFHPLLAASFYGYIDMVRILISEGNVNVNFQNEHTHFGLNALRVAIWRNHPDIIKLLLEHKAKIENIDRRSIRVHSPIVEAVACGNKTALTLIFNELSIRSNNPKLRGQKKVGFFKKVEPQCVEAFMKACKRGIKSTLVDMLLRQGGVDVNLCVDQDRLLSYAARYHRVSIVQLLVRQGARMENERDCGIATAMRRSHDVGDIEQRRILSGIVIYLLKSGCNVANGGIHACALWFMANLEQPRPFGTDRQREEIKRLLFKNGYDPKECQHGCGEAHSLEQYDKRQHFPYLPRL